MIGSSQAGVGPAQANTARGAILIVEDDKKTAELLSIYLQREGFSTIAAYSGREALNLTSRHKPVFTILDLMLPDLDGWELCSKFRNSSAVPILILSALGGAQDRIRGFALGADDYVVKPFSPKELVARVKAILRRARADLAEKETFVQGDLALDVHNQKVTLGGKGISLTRSEYRLLKALIAVPGRVFCRDELLRCLYPAGGIVIDRVVDVHIASLRQKIEADSSKPRYILTARGAGYQFADREPRSGELE